MSKIICDRCKKKMKSKSGLQSHLRRKVPCEIKVDVKVTSSEQLLQKQEDDQVIVLREDKRLEMNGMIIISRVSDCYIDATTLCKAANKKYNHWKDNANTDQFLELISKETDISVSLLIKQVKGKGKDQHTWVHPKVALDIAYSLSVKFKVKVVGWIHELLVTGSVTLGQEKTSQELEKIQRDLFEERTKNQALITSSHADKAKYDDLEKKMDKLSIAYNATKNHRKLPKLGSLPCFYIYSILGDSLMRFKIGKAEDIHHRLSNHRTSAVYIYLHYLVYTEKNSQLESMMKIAFEDNLKPCNHEFIMNVPVDDIITTANGLLTSCRFDHTVEEELESYNKHINYWFELDTGLSLK